MNKMNIAKGLLLLLSVTLSILLNVFVSFGSSLNSSDKAESEKLIVVDSADFYHAMQLHPFIIELTSAGWSHIMSDRPMQHGLESFDLAVMDSVSEAIAMFGDLAGRMSIRPSKYSFNIGDDIVVWDSGEVHGGTVIFRRLNIVTRISWKGGIQEGIAFVKTLDNYYSKRARKIDSTDATFGLTISGVSNTITGKRGSKLVLNPVIQGVGHDKLTVIGTLSDSLYQPVGSQNSLIFLVPKDKGSYPTFIIAGKQSNFLVVRKKTMLKVD